MIYMTKNFSISICILLFCSSCNYVSYSQIVPMARTAVFGVPDVIIDEQYIENKEFSFAKVKIGKTGIAIMTLSQINDNVYSWISSSGEKLNTLNGKVISISGSSFDMKLFNHANFELNNEFPVYLDAQMMLQSPRAFIEYFSKTQKLNFDDNDLFYYEEVVAVKGFKWNFINRYWVDPLTKRVTRTLQTIHPKQPEIEITYYYK